MAIGAGKYDDACTVARESTLARGVVLIVFNGDKGDGFSVQADRALNAALPDLLERLATLLRADLAHVDAHAIDQRAAEND